jgi:hypothetical protein
MKKIITVALIIGLLAGAMLMPAEAKKKKKPYVRVVEATYDNPAPGIGGVLTLNGAGGTVGVPTLENEAYISVEITDTSGTDVYFGLSQEDTDGDGIGEIIAGGCGKTAAPLAITGGLQHTITITAGPGSEDPTCAGVATSGTVKVTLTETA